MTREDALRVMLHQPAQVARWCGYPLLTDELHGKWIRSMMRDGEDMTLLAHRGSYKTTCLTMAAAMLMCVNPTQSIMLLRKTDADTAELLRQVKRIFDADAMQYLTAAVYGYPVRLVRSTTESLTCGCYAAPRGAAQLTGCSVGANLTGKHAERVFTDDIVTVADRVSAAERERTRQIYMELQNVRTPGGRIVNIGTPWHKDDAISLMPGVERYDCYRTKLLAPTRLQKLREAMSPSLFAVNYELKHIADDKALFGGTTEFTADKRNLWGGIAHVDAAYGGDDYTALTCGQRCGEKIYLYGRLWQAHVDTVMEEVAAVYHDLRCGRIWCETNADKGYVARQLQERSCSVRRYHEQTNKHLKIATFLRKWWKNIVFLEGTDMEYIAQIMDYTETAAHDDAPDSAACVCRLLDRGES